MYQNIPPNSKALSDPRPVSSCRLETATPNRLSEKFDSDRSNESQGDFRRSASARLPKHKTRATDYLNNTFNEESDDSKKNSEQVGVSIIQSHHPSLSMNSCTLTKYFSREKNL